MDTPLGAHFLIIHNIHSRLSTHVSHTTVDKMLKCRQFTQFKFYVPARSSFLQCMKVLTQFYLRLPQSHPKLCAYGALSLASHFMVSCRPRDVVPRVFRLSQTLCVVSVRRAVPKPWTRHCPHSASWLLRSVAKFSETNYCKLWRISS